jgi:hypothetical protein
MKKVPFLLIIVFVFLLSCSKGAYNDDNLAPVVSITNPVNNQQFNNGDNIRIMGSIADDKHLAEVHLHVYNIGTGAKLLDEHIYPSGLTASVDRTIVASAGIDYKIEIIAKDLALNEGRTWIEVSCN